MDPTSPTARRPLTSRNSAWAASAARACLKAGLSPNTISIASVFFAVLAAVFFVSTPAAKSTQGPWLLILGALMVQARLLCNLLDGMVAIEGGKKTKTGEIFNELPDRIADPIILIGAGYYFDPILFYRIESIATFAVFGWLAAALALLTAYVRALGVAAGASQQFCGPMAKPHRMAVITLAALAQAICVWARIHMPVMTYGLAIICIGCVITIVRRTLRIATELESK